MAVKTKEHLIIPELFTKFPHSTTTLTPSQNSVNQPTEIRADNGQE